MCRSVFALPNILGQFWDKIWPWKVHYTGVCMTLYYGKIITSQTVFLPERIQIRVHIEKITKQLFVGPVSFLIFQFSYDFIDLLLSTSPKGMSTTTAVGEGRNHTNS